MVRLFSISTFFLHPPHLKPVLIIRSLSTNLSRQSLRLILPRKRTARLGISTLKSMKLSNAQSEKLQLKHCVLFISYPPNRSVIIESSRSLQYLSHSSLYLSMLNLSNFSSLYGGFVRTRFNSSCILSSKKRMNSYESCYPYPVNCEAPPPVRDTALFIADGVIQLPPELRHYRKRS